MDKWLRWICLARYEEPKLVALSTSSPVAPKVRTSLLITDTERWMGQHLAQLAQLAQLAAAGCSWQRQTKHGGHVGSQRGIEYLQMAATWL